MQIHRSRAVPRKLVDDLVVGAVQWVPLMLLASILLDGGNIFRWSGVAILGYFLGVMAIAVKRLDYSSVTDRAFVRWGVAPLMVIAVAMEPWVHYYVRW